MDPFYVALIAFVIGVVVGMAYSLLVYLTHNSCPSCTAEARKRERERWVPRKGQVSQPYGDDYR